LKYQEIDRAAAPCIAQEKAEKIHQAVLTHFRAFRQNLCEGSNARPHQQQTRAVIAQAKV
jgi:hypothetical protein